MRRGRQREASRRHTDSLPQRLDGVHGPILRLDVVLETAPVHGRAAGTMPRSPPFCRHRRRAGRRHVPFRAASPRDRIATSRFLHLGDSRRHASWRRAVVRGQAATAMSPQGYRQDAPLTPLIPQPRWHRLGRRRCRSPRCLGRRRGVSAHE